MGLYIIEIGCFSSFVFICFESNLLFFYSLLCCCCCCCFYSMVVHRRDPPNWPDKRVVNGPWPRIADQAPSITIRHHHHQQQQHRPIQLVLLVHRVALVAPGPRRVWPVKRASSPTTTIMARPALPFLTILNTMVRRVRRVPPRRMDRTKRI